MSALRTFDKKLIQSDPFLEKFKNELATFSDLKKTDGIVVAVSGGMDSMALLLSLDTIDEFELFVAHVNHNLRPDSDKDEILVRNLSDHFGISCYSNSLDPMTIEKGESVEKWARTKRYDFLNQIVEHTNSKWIMTAHHGNDQVETVLMNLSRQSGISGLCGIGKQNGKVLRPLLGFTKKELIDFVKRNEIPFHEDATNSDLSIPRNFIRHTVVKPWENEVQSLISGIQGSVEHFSEWMEALDHFIFELIIPKVNRSVNQFEIPLNGIENMPNMTKVRLVQLLLDASYHELWSKHQIEQLKSFFQKDEIGNKHILPNGWRLLRDRKSILGKEMTTQTKINPVELLPDHPVDFNQYRYELFLEGQSNLDSTQNREQVDWSLLKDQKLEIRSWTNGDYFQPLGMEGHQKISDFLINEKVDRFAKKSQAVITANGEIIWVCGRRIADWVKLTEKTKETAILKRNHIPS